ncbi:glycoside hydrolase family 78 protein [Xylariaceae sp. FL0255]|nr:glycoside hydrolase family 78 protein [Xylariaceae sp. FL0255]
MVRSIDHFLAPLTAALLSLSQPTSAQNCWQDTTCSSVTEPSFSGPWDSYYFAPTSRTIPAKNAFDIDTGSSVVQAGGIFTISSSQTGIYVDFGQEVGGIPSIDYTVTATNGAGALGVAFTEAKNWIGRSSDSTEGGSPDNDGAIYSNFTSTGDVSYTVPLANLRGGFRYMTLFLVGDDVSVTSNNISLELSFQPTWSNLRAYSGYFYSNDNLLNKLWYSGAYTLQTDAIASGTGRNWPAPSEGWQNDAYLGPGDSYTSDGAKRDRTLWPGDMGVSVPAGFYSTGDSDSVKNSLAVFYSLQDSNGGLPFAGPPVYLGNSSITYHLWTMIGLYNYVYYSGDQDFLSTTWMNYTKAMTFALSLVDPDVGLVNITNYPNDWGRYNTTGYQASASMLLYRTLMTGAEMAGWVGDTTGLNATWTATAANLSSNVQDKLWDSSVGAFLDNYGSYNYGLHPQDGNSLAIASGLVDPNSDQAQNISTWLTTNWESIGPNCPELSGQVSPFISSIELQAHLLAGQSQRALDLIRTSWGWYLNNENGTQSTMIEGYVLDGTFGYRYGAGGYPDASYTSHSHGWSTGPVTALSSQILGLSISSIAGQTWSFVPQLGNLTSVQGGFTSSLGLYSASASVDSSGCPLTYGINTPTGTSGTVLLPAGTCTTSITIDGAPPSTGQVSTVCGPGGQQLYSFSIAGGNHSFVVS